MKRDASLAGLLTAIVVLATPLAALGQTTLTYDGSTNTLLGDTKVRAKTKVRVKLTNVNTFTHSYKLKGEQIDIFTTASPAPLGDLLLRTKPSSTAFEAAKNFGLGGVAPEGLLDTAFKAFLTQVMVVMGALGPDLPSGASSLDQKLAAIIFDPSNSNLELKKAIVAPIEASIPGDGSPIERIQRVLDKLKAHPQALDAHMVKLRESRKEFFDALVGSTAPDEDKLGRAKIVQEIYAETEDYVQQDVKAVEGVAERLRRAKSMVAAVYAAPDEPLLGPVEAAKDELVLNVIAEPTETYIKVASTIDTTSIPQTRSVNTKLETFGRQVLDYSVGFATTGLVDKILFKRDTTADATVNPTVFKGPNPGNNVQFMALAHYFKTPEPGQSTLVFPSVGVTFREGKFRALLGASYLADKVNRMYVTAGLAYGPTDRYKGWKTGDLVTDKDDFKSFSVNRPSWFLGVSFNLRS